MSRKFTKMLWDMLESEIVSKEYILKECLNWLSEDDVKEMMKANDLLNCEEEEE